MKNSFIFILTAMLFLGCSEEEKLYQQQISFRNTSVAPLSIIITGDLSNSDRNDTLINVILRPTESTMPLSYVNNSFIGSPFDLKYMKIKFTTTDRGYICSDNSIDNLCFTNKRSPIGSSTSADDFELENGVYYYDITNDDYEKAYLLPQ
ncbi:hypothetical protein [Flavobacterium sp. HSC-61S13]|uniref:hypothetical protein n=1 Tax=Flavobacterium sp. HSC-61S13 TaxID=2910963 RepID=UPI00209E7A19|nr:hypothetical protein [Flavobacterium sp. HSC-61S13]MCP1994616.1 hypothetical protein [Flavobacterium sp. HSC-61S13]